MPRSSSAVVGGVPATWRPTSRPPRTGSCSPSTTRTLGPRHRPRRPHQRADRTRRWPRRGSVARADPAALTTSSDASRTYGSTSTPRHPATLRPLVRLLAMSAGALDRVCLASFSDARLRWLRSALGPRVCTVARAARDRPAQARLARGSPARHRRAALRRRCASRCRSVRGPLPLVDQTLCRHGARPGSGRARLDRRRPDGDARAPRPRRRRDHDRPAGRPACGPATRRPVAGDSPRLRAPCLSARRRPLPRGPDSFL